MIKLDKDSIKINSVWANRFFYHDESPKHELQEMQVLGIDWSCNLGFGSYELHFEEDGAKVVAYSEYMDCDEDKSFLRALLEKVADMAEVVE